MTVVARIALARASNDREPSPRGDAKVARAFDSELDRAREYVTRTRGHLRGDLAQTRGDDFDRRTREHGDRTRPREERARDGIEHARDGLEYARTPDGRRSEGGDRARPREERARDGVEHARGVEHERPRDGRGPEGVAHARDGIDRGRRLDGAGDEAATNGGDDSDAAASGDELARAGLIAVAIAPSTITPVCLGGADLDGDTSGDRAAGAAGATSAAVAAPTVEAASAASAIAPTADATGSDDEGEEPLTPLEQAVIDLLERGEVAGEVTVVPDPGRGPPATRGAQGPAAVASVATAREVPEPAAPTSHVHLVLDEGEARMVVTVAVRGSEVNVALRGGDELTAASLARNAGVLEQALRSRGFGLAELETGPDFDDTRRRDQPARRAREDARERERFQIEEDA